jgi:transcriptional regulator with XRE-family HTH domain
MTSHFEEVYADPQRRRQLQQEITILDATERVHEAMNAQGVSRVELARRLGTSKGHVTQLLDGSRNMTLRTLSDMFFALGLAVTFEVESVKDYAAEVHVTYRFPVNLTNQKSVTRFDLNLPKAS